MELEGPDRPQFEGTTRASDRDRERAVSALRAHFRAGRLDADELERRVAAALAATTREALRALRSDLPRRRRRRRGPVAALRRALRRRRRRRQA